MVPVETTETLRFGDATVLLSFASTYLRDAMMPAFGHLRTFAQSSDEQIIVLGQNGRIGVGRRDGPVSWGRMDQGAPLLKLALTEIALDHLNGLAIHTATLLRGSGAMLLLGEPGAGKSTLSLHLDQKGFCIAGDDLADLLPDGRIRALPFAATLKEGAWSLLERDDITSAPIFHRPDRKVVRYLPIDAAGSGKAHRVDWIVVLDRRDGAALTVTQLSTTETFAALLQSAWSGKDALSPDGFDALAAAINTSRCIRLTYCDLSSAAKALDQFCGADAQRMTGSAEVV
ncbi:hypothetical protein LX81_04296 [Palleronia aestuarii]|uniref:Hpr(Ser) kinase/phosphatase n=1 Tax=Palleronia aestuarii TaxID=568105 RepID=A0A2W7MRF9_9RHOB|nr:hypothetical protein [Palleronia aestuarii]PZX10153.1 hypothetical protein LX81_04296 [Palleronia aestuarii]